MERAESHRYLPRYLYVGAHSGGKQSRRHRNLTRGLRGIYRRDATTSAEGVEEHLTKLDRLLHKIPPWVYFNIRNRREIYYAILLYGTM